MWTYKNPVHIFGGADSLRALQTGIVETPYVIVTYKDDFFHGLVKKISTLVGTAPIGVVEVVESNPSFEAMQSLCKNLADMQEKPRTLIALGGGSVIDACKALSACGGSYQTLYNYFFASGSLPNTAIPFIAIPTTSGTGSEVTSWATLWDMKNKKKYSCLLYTSDAADD